MNDLIRCSRLMGPLTSSRHFAPFKCQLKKYASSALSLRLLHRRWLQSRNDGLHLLDKNNLTHNLCKHTSSKTSFSLNCVKAEHSTYFTAPSSFAILSPSSFRTGDIFCFANFSRTCGSSLKSVCVPTIRHGTPGQWWWTSGNHFSRTFSKEAGEVTEKQTRKTSV